MIYGERKREKEKERGGEREGWWQGGLNMMQTIWSGERRLPAQPALFKLERKWPYIQHASKLPLPHCLSLSPLFSSALTFTHTHKWGFRSFRVYAHTHPQRSNDGHWLKSVFVILILCFFTSPSPGPSPLLSLLLLLQSGRLGGTRERENEGASRGEKSQERDWKMKGRARGRRRGQCFPSTLHDLIWFRSIETFPGMRICYKKWETQEKKKMNSEEGMMERKLMRKWEEE